MISEGVMLYLSPRCRSPQGRGIGSAKFKDKLLEDRNVATVARAWASEGVAKIRRRQCARRHFSPFWQELRPRKCEMRLSARLGR